MMTSFRMYYTLCPQSEIFELATVMKERLLGDFSRKISILIIFSIKFSIPRNLSTKLLDSEKFLENSSRFREDDIYKYRVLWLCSSVAEPRELMTKEELKSQKCRSGGRRRMRCHHYLLNVINYFLEQK